MHGYHFPKDELKKKLDEEFENGQLFLVQGANKTHLRLIMNIETEEGYQQLLKQIGAGESDKLGYWGEMGRLRIPKLGRKLLVEFNWLCVQRAGNDRFGTEVPRWFLIQQPSPCAITMDIDFTGFYFPKAGKRIKVWTSLLMVTSLGEFCRFYKKDDPDRLVWNGEEYVPLKLALPILVPAT
ncbi:MAG: hypothetical protein EXS59_02960 [Candidatus Taylorbacteria bacterium]|nr:hypothetical protein [Candidatus Taylorbacteria bacterium]